MPFFQKHKNLAVLIIFFIFGFLIFGNSLANNFVFDDFPIVHDRPELRNIEHFWNLLFEPYHDLEFDADAYRPVTMMSFSLNFFLLGEKPWGFHLVNILLHILASWLAFLLILKIANRIKAKNRENNFYLAFGASFLFLILPIHTEPINTIVGRAEMLSLIFGFLSILILLKTGEKNKTKKISLQFYAALCLLLAILAKESAIEFLPLYIIILWNINLGKNNFIQNCKLFFQKYWLNLAYLGSAVFVYFAMRLSTLDGLANTRATIVENPLKFADVSERILTAIKILGMYLAKIIWPLNNLSSDYSYNQISLNFSWLNFYFWLGLSFLIFLIIILIFNLFKPGKKIIFALSASIFLFFYLLISNLIFPIGTILAERLMYLPSLGICLLIVYGLIVLYQKFFKNNKNLKIIYFSLILVIIIFYSLISFFRNFDWRSEESLFLSAAKMSPDSVLARSNAGAIYLINNDLVNAEREILAAQNIYDNYNHNLNNLGLLYLKQGKLEEAREQFEAVIKKYPEYSKAWDNLALTYLRLGEHDKALRRWTVLYGDRRTAKLYLQAYLGIMK